MLNDIAKNIIIKALRIRQERGEDPRTVIETWPRLAESEKTEVLASLEKGAENDTGQI